MGEILISSGLQLGTASLNTSRDHDRLLRSERSVIGAGAFRLGGDMDVKQELLARLQLIITEQLGVQHQLITEESTWTELGADSLDRLWMSLAIEDAFDVNIPHPVGERLNTVGETVDYLLVPISVRNGFPISQYSSTLPPEC